jgi:molybdopterin synthase sulfur carrier subunit
MTDPADGTVSASRPAETVPVGEGATLADVLAAVRARHGARSRLADVLAVCSVLVGDRPVGSRAPEDVSVWPGQTVEMLPPFAGG